MTEATSPDGASPPGSDSRRMLAVWLDGAPGPIGVLTAQGAGPASGGFPLWFAYDPAYLRHPEAVPLSASLPLRPDAYL